MQRWVDDEEMAAVAVFGLEEDQLKRLCASVDGGNPSEKMFLEPKAQCTVLV